jgi:hypothetical protein
VTAAVLDRPSFAQPALDGGGTLEELLGSALQGARMNGSTECPVCHGAMTASRAGAREPGAAAPAPAADCSACGTRLS